MKRAFAVVLVLALPAATLSTFTAAAEKKPAAHADAGDRHDPDNVTGISVTMETLAKGIDKLAAKETPAAIDLFKKAIALSPKDPFAHYLLGEGYLVANNHAEAAAAFRAASELPEGKNAALRSRVLFALADVLERQKKWPEAKAAWQAYAEHASKHADAGFPATSAARLQVIEKLLEREKAYVAVRERIAAEKDAGKK